MDILTARAELVTRLNNLGGIPAQPWAGRLSVNDLAGEAVKTPIYLIGCLGIGDYQNSAQSVCGTIRWVVYCLAKSQAGKPREDAAMVMAEAVTRQVSHTKFGGPNGGQPGNMRVDNLFSGNAGNKTGLALWSVTFDTAYREGVMTDAAYQALPGLLTALTTYDIAPADGNPEAQDTQNLPQ